MKHDWKEHLAHISSQVQKHLRIEDAVLQKPQIGAVYGFWSSVSVTECLQFVMCSIPIKVLLSYLRKGMQILQPWNCIVFIVKNECILQNIYNAAYVAW
jgi:hypothetical protein